MGHAPVAQLCPNCHAGPSRQPSGESPALRPTPSAGLSLPPSVLDANRPDLDLVAVELEDDAVIVVGLGMNHFAQIESHSFRAPVPWLAFLAPLVIALGEVLALPDRIHDGPVANITALTDQSAGKLATRGMIV